MFNTAAAIVLPALSLIGSIVLGIRSQRRHRPILGEREPNAPLGVHIEQAIAARMPRRAGQ